MTPGTGAPFAAFGWNPHRARALFWVHFPLALLHLPLALVIVGLPGFLLFGYFALRSWRRWRHRGAVFELHEHGFVDRRTGITRRNTWRALHSCTLVDRTWRFPFPFNFVVIHHVGLIGRLDGRHFVLNEHLDGIRECVALAQRALLAAHLPAAREQLACNGELRFGGMAMNNAGLRFGRRELPWPAFGGLRCGSWRAGRRAEAALQVLDSHAASWEILTRTQLPDAVLFITLVAERTGGVDTATLLRDFCLMNDHAVAALR